MIKTTITCDYCKEDITDRPLGYVVVKSIDKTINWPDLEVCGFKCLYHYLGDRVNALT